MKERMLTNAIFLAFPIAVFGWPPFRGGPTSGYAEGNDGFVSEVRRLRNWGF